MQKCLFIYLLPQLCIEVIFLKGQRWLSLLCWGLSTTWSQSSKTVTMSCVSRRDELLQSWTLQKDSAERGGRKKWNPRKCCQNNLSSGITCKRGKSRQLLTAQQWDTETPEHLLLPFRSGPSSWNTRTQRAVFWIRTLLIIKEPADREGGFKGENREMGRAKRGPGKDGCQLFLQSLHLRLLGASLHPALPPSSSAAAQGLLQQRKTLLMVQTERSVFVLRTESLPL